MTTHKLIVTSIILILFFGCDNKVHRRQNEIKRIVFATGGCPGTCPVQVIDIDSSLTVKYHGIQFADSVGFYVGHVSNAFWDTLNLKFESIKYKNLDSIYEHSSDNQTTEIYIYYGDKKFKHVYGQWRSLPDSVLTAYNWLLMSMKKIKLIHSSDTIIFPAQIQKGIPPPPVRNN